MDPLVDFLNTYDGRDKVIRLFEYFSQFLAGCTPRSYSSRFQIFSSQLSSCRVILRLFDDLSALRYTLKYGLGEEDVADVKIRIFSILTNLFDQIYYPLEHIAWAEDVGLIQRNKRINWWAASSICWALSSYFSLSASLQHAKNLNAEKSALKMYGSEIKLLGPRYKEYVHLSHLQFLEILSALRCLIDLIEAIHYLPKGFLWSNTLRDWQIGGLGTMSSVISLFQSYMLNK